MERRWDMDLCSEEVDIAVKIVGRGVLAQR